MSLELTRPIVFIDLEGTGTDPSRDRIVEISTLKEHPDGTKELKTRRIDPGVPIPPEATAIHGITNEDVANEPTFRQVAKSLAEFLIGCDLAGFGIHRYDIPLLIAEFDRSDVPFDLQGRSVIDALSIYHAKEPRNLAAAMRYYCDEELEDAHSAEADIKATYRVMMAQLERYDDLSRRPQELHSFCNRGREHFIDPMGRLVWKDGEAAFNFGKYRGTLVREVASEAPAYFDWVVSNDFSLQVKEIMKKAREGEFPRKD